jgi:hypothetical protein
VAESDEARRARQARNSAAYRARQKAAQAGRATPPDPAIVKRAQNYARDLRERRAAAISSLPNVQNPRARLRPGEVTERAAPLRSTRRGQQTQASRIRDRANAERLQEIGRARREQLRTELNREDGPLSLRSNMTADQRAEFQHYSNRIAAGSQQSIAILFEYAGGQSDYSMALERILASPDSRDVEEGLAILAKLADTAERAAVMYAPSRIGRLSV